MGLASEIVVNLLCSASRLLYINRVNEANRIQTAMAINTTKFINLCRLGAIKKRVSEVILINSTRTDADKDSGKGYMNSARASYVNGDAAP